MLDLVKVSEEYAEEIYALLQKIPADENGFTNTYYDMDHDTFMTQGMKELLDSDQGINLPNGFVPSTDYYLRLDGEMIGLYHFRHYVNDFLKQGPGHIGYGILKEQRGHGYAAKGLQMLLDAVRESMIDEEFYLECNADNPASLKTQLKCGAYVHHRDEVHIYTRIPVSAAKLYN